MSVMREFKILEQRQIHYFNIPQALFYLLSRLLKLEVQESNGSKWIVVEEADVTYTLFLPVEAA